MGNLSDKRDVNIKPEIHYVYYVADMENRSWMTRFRKMDAGREIARYICKSLKHCKLMDYIEYDGDVIEADSIGIIFPTHMWGSSLAVYSFLRHLKACSNAYVYAVAVGETLSGDVRETLSGRINSLEEFRRIFVRRGLGTEDDIYVRCIDRACLEDVTEVNDNDYRQHISLVMEKLMFNNMNKAVTGDAVKTELKTYNEGELIIKNQTENKKSRLGNVYLDDDMLSGVRLCRVM